MTTTTTRATLGAIAATVLVTAVAAANWLTSTFGFVPVGFGQAATAGTFAAGFALAARDALQDTLGKAVMLAVLAVAAQVVDVAYAVRDETATLVVQVLDSRIVDGNEEEIADTIVDQLAEAGLLRGAW